MLLQENIRLVDRQIKNFTKLSKTNLLQPVVLDIIGLKHLAGKIITSIREWNEIVWD